MGMCMAGSKAAAASGKSARSGFEPDRQVPGATAAAHLPSHTPRWNSLKTMLGHCCMLLVVSNISSGHSHTTPDRLPSSDSKALEAWVRPCR